MLPPLICPALRRGLFSLLCLTLAGLAACQRTPDITEFAGTAQGTTYHIKAVLPETADHAALRKAIEGSFQHIDEVMSNYREDSEISRFNQQKTRNWVSVAPEITELFTIAKTVSAQTQGCYDLTIQPLFKLWGFSGDQNRVPSEDEIRAVLSHIGMQRIEADPAQHRLRKLDPEVQIDLSSIAQGYTVGAMANLLERHGVHDYLVEIGGEMKVRGKKPDGSAWRVAIEKPNPDARAVQRVLEMPPEPGTAVMTAGTYRHFFEENGKVYSHILDPRTGYPVTHDLRSVTVLHADPTWADAWDTALLCVGQPEAARLAEAEQLKVLLITGEKQPLQEYQSPVFQQAGVTLSAPGSAPKDPTAPGAKQP